MSAIAVFYCKVGLLYPMRLCGICPKILAGFGYSDCGDSSYFLGTICARILRQFADHQLILPQAPIETTLDNTLGGRVCCPSRYRTYCQTIEILFPVFIAISLLIIGSMIEVDLRTCSYIH